MCVYPDIPFIRIFADMNRYKTIHIFILLLIITGFTACEKDDVCLAPMTPKLILRFVDNNSPDDYKEVSHLYVIAMPVEDTIYKNVSKDSIAIPLDVNQNTCTYKFVNDQNVDVLNFTYQRESVFVSKACGYKSVFHQLQTDVVPDSDNWINSINVEKQEVTIDTIAHVKIYH